MNQHQINLIIIGVGLGILLVAHLIITRSALIRQVIQNVDLSD